MTAWDDIEIDDTPRAEVQRIGRWTYRVSIKRGLIDGYDWHVFGRHRAARKAAKVLRRYLRDQMRQSETVTIDFQWAADWRAQAGEAPHADT